MSGAQAISADYRFLVDDPYLPEVECTLTLTGLTGTIELTLPERVGFATFDAPRLTGEVALVGPGDLVRESPYVWVLQPEGERAELRWTVPLDHHGLPEVAGDEYQFPYLREDHGMLSMGTLALAPTRERAGSIRVAFEAPPDWPVIAPWTELEPGRFELDERAGWTPLHDDLVALGDWTLERADAGGVEVTVAVAGSQPVVQSLALERIVPVVEAEVELFGGPQHGRYLFLFCEPTRGGYGGSPRNTSMTLYVSGDLPVDFVRGGITHLIAHEYHHTWMKAAGLDPRGVRFFAEGFTDWYATLVPWWLGFKDERAVEQTLADKLVEFESGLARFDGTLVDAGGPAFFSGRGTAYETTYAGGLVLAAWLDLAIARAAEASGADGADRTLDDFMRAVYGDPRWSEGDAPTLDDLVERVAEFTDAAVAARFRELALTRGNVDLVALFAEVGVELERRIAEPDFSIRANFDGTTVEAIDGKDLMALVGIGGGDRLIEVNGRAVTTEGEVRSAWREPRGGRIALVVERARTGEQETIDVPVPETAEYTVPQGSLTSCAR